MRVASSEGTNRSNQLFHRPARRKSMHGRFMHSIPRIRGEEEDEGGAFGEEHEGLHHLGALLRAAPVQVIHEDDQAARQTMRPQPQESDEPVHDEIQSCVVQQRLDFEGKDGVQDVVQDSRVPARTISNIMMGMFNINPLQGSEYDFEILLFYWFHIFSPILLRS